MELDMKSFHYAAIDRIQGVIFFSPVLFLTVVSDFFGRTRVSLATRDVFAPTSGSYHLCQKADFGCSKT
jgi:hypothetical protein